jgi:hypothetical protein
MTEVLVLRAASSAGKTTFANLLKRLHPNACICTADDYMYEIQDDGSSLYVFKPEKLGRAHVKCQEKFKWALDNALELVIVANTNTSSREWKFYEDYAKSKGAKTTFLVLEKRHENVNDHAVPHIVLQQQASRIRQSLKLI